METGEAGLEDIGHSDFDVGVKPGEEEEEEEEKKKKKRLIIIIIIIIIILLFLLIGITIPLCLRKKTKITKPEIVIQDWDRDKDKDSTWSVVPDFIFDTKPSEEEYGACDVNMRYKVNGGKWTKWGVYNHELIKGLVGTLEFEFKYSCDKGESPTSHIKFTVKEGLPELNVSDGNTVGSE